MTQLEEWLLKGIADTLRLVVNHFHSSDRKTCLDRMIILSWNWVVVALMIYLLRQIVKMVLCTE